MLKRNIEKENEVPQLIESIYIQSYTFGSRKFKQALKVMINACDSDDSDEINDEHNSLNSANKFFKRVISSDVSLSSSGSCLSDFLWDLRSVINCSDYHPVPEAAIERVEMFSNMIRNYKNIHGERYCSKAAEKRHQPYNGNNNNNSNGFNFNFDFILRILYFAIGIYFSISAISVSTMDDMEDFMKKVASEYNAPLSEVHNELGFAVNSEYKWFPLPHTVWYVTKENGQDVEVGESSTFGGTEIYKDKLDQFFYLEFWSGRESLEEQKRNAMREAMRR